MKVFIRDIVVLTFWFVGKRLDKETRVNFQIYDVKDWPTNNYNTNITQYLK